MQDREEPGGPGSGAVSREERLALTFDGVGLQCCKGATVAAALVTAGIQEFRESAGGPRGLYCGMGVCQECLVTIDGMPGRRACMTPARDGMRVERQPARVRPGSAGSALAARKAPVIAEKPQVLVIGGGPAGLTAAATAAEAGASVVLLDERGKPGGQYFKQPASAPVPSLAQDRQYADGRRLIERASRAGVDIRRNSIVWGGFPGPEIHVAGPDGPAVLRPGRLVVASGAYERGHAVPGWTLPGVMTTGAAQSLLRVNGVTPPGRVLVAGNGPLNLQVALELARAGARVCGLAELAPRPGPARAGRAAAMLAAAPALALTGLGMLAGLRAQHVPTHFGYTLGAVTRAAGALRVRLVRADGRSGAPIELDVDAVCLGYGFYPDNELLRLLGCGHEFDPRRDQLVTCRDDDCRTTVAGVFAVGDCAGTGGAAIAQAEGVIAGLAASRDCGFASDPRQERRARRALARHRRFQAALWSLFAPAGEQVQPGTPETILCRCENVCSRELDAAIDEGCATLGAIKRRTRLGMGPCQGRYCVPVALSRLAQRSGTQPGEFDRAAPRPPLRPLSVADLAGGRADD